MYEMEGPRLRPAALASRLLGHRALRDACLAALANRLLRCVCCVAPPVVRFPTSAPVARPFHRSRGFPRGRIPSSVVRDFYCQSAAAHKAFRREVQDSLAIHRTSVVYPVCMAAFHRAVHSLSTGPGDDGLAGSGLDHQRRGNRDGEQVDPASRRYACDVVHNDSELHRPASRPCSPPGIASSTSAAEATSSAVSSAASLPVRSGRSARPGTPRLADCGRARLSFRQNTHEARAYVLVRGASIRFSLR